MDYETLRDSLDGLFAYDTGSTDSGIHDEALRERCKAHLQGLKDDDRRHLLGKMVAEMWLSEEALKKGYGPEDAKSFLTWLDDEMGCLV